MESRRGSSLRTLDALRDEPANAPARALRAGLGFSCSLKHVRPGEVPIVTEIVLQRVSESVAFARDSGKHMAELRNMVTSPGGTSAEAIYQMEKGGLRTVLSKSVYAAYQRTQTLAAEQERTIDQS